MARSNKKKNKILKGGKKNFPWKGWSNLKPSTHQRSVMLKDCGHYPCFLGKDKSFPVCIKNTCNISKKGLWAAYIRAKQWGKPKSIYKGKTKPSMKRNEYLKISKKAKSMLENREVNIGK
jgi:hypothetical protein